MVTTHPKSTEHCPCLNSPNVLALCVPEIASCSLPSWVMSELPPRISGIVGVSGMVMAQSAKLFQKPFSLSQCQLSACQISFIRSVLNFDTNRTSIAGVGER